MTKRSMTVDDHRFLMNAVNIARVHMERGHGGPFGALIVKDGILLAEGWNEVTTANDPTAHAEVVAIRRACASLGSFSLTGTTIYASCEPCPMCLGAIYWAHIDRLVFAGNKADAAAAGFDDAFIYEEFERDAAKRRLVTVHSPLIEMDAVFSAWLAKTDRKPY